MTSNEDTKSEANWGPRIKRFLLWGALAAFLIGGFWFWRPWWHWLAYTLVYKAPGVLQWAIVGAGMCLVALIASYLSAPDDDDSDDRHRRRAVTAARDGFMTMLWKKATTNMDGKMTVLFMLGIVVMVGGLVVGGIVGGLYTNLHMAEQVESNVEDVDTLPTTDANAPRILPYEVSQQYAQNSLQYPRHQLEGGDITYIDGQPHWSYALAPDGGMNSLFAAKQEGAVYVDMTTSGSDVSVQETTFEKGQGMAVWRGYKWQMLKNDYRVDYQDPMMVPHDDSQYIVVPYQTHDHEFRMTPLPQVYSVPEFGGVKIMHPDGTIEDVPADEVDDNAILDGQRVYPYDLAKYKVNSMRYQHGAMNKWFYHEDELELAPAPGVGNDQPFTVTTEDGIKYFVAAEPWGDASGVYQVWTFDARSGDMERMKVDIDSAMLGPNRAVNYVRQENPMVDWDRMNPVEPIPVVRDGTLYWQVKIVPTDGAGVSYTAFVNADTSDVTTVQEDAAVRAFIAGIDEAFDDVTSGTDGGSDSSSEGGTLVITIQHDDGTTEQIEVEEGSSITIENRGNESSDE